MESNELRRVDNSEINGVIMESAMFICRDLKNIPAFTMLYLIIYNTVNIPALDVFK